MAKVRNILQKKGTAVFSVNSGTTVYEAIEKMNEKHIGGVLIVDDGKLVGIFTERDYARKLILQGLSCHDTTIDKVMTPNPFTVSPDDSIEDCMKMMTNKHIRHLPVVENGKLGGMISIGDLVKSIIEEQQFIIEHLESYITH
ncbi:MAG TPA: CBS domain-containing protein [Cyclobacteriaceae bacterium]|nr:CBS domain-containing protein [Cyclobacteriaceae bacterium]